jgi:hypothetical protein
MTHMTHVTSVTSLNRKKIMSAVLHMPSQTNLALPRGRLAFGLDATASRASSWARACELQAKMFREAAPIGKLSVQLVFFRGLSECRASKWCQSGDELAQLMHKIDCEGGYTQIGRVLGHVLREHAQAPVQALILIGDSMEEEIGALAGLASQLGKARVPIFAFQEGRDAVVRSAFRLLALKSGGEYFEFNPDKPRAVEQLSEQLNAVARLAVGDVKARQPEGDRQGCTPGKKKITAR